MTNEEMDTAVLSSVRAGKTRAGAVGAHLQLDGRRTSFAAACAIRRALQRLRRRGFVAYDRRTGWRVRT